MFEGEYWLCVSEYFRDAGICRGWVENGDWSLIYNEETWQLHANNKPIRVAKLIWAADAKSEDYNEAIELAKEEYEIRTTNKLP